MDDTSNKYWYPVSIVLLNVALLSIAFGAFENSLFQYYLPDFVESVWPSPGAVFPVNQFNDPSLGHGIICFHPKDWKDSYYLDFYDLKLNRKTFHEYYPPNKVISYGTDFESYVCWDVPLPPGRYLAEIQIKDHPVIYWRFRLTP